jgi:hypothetical protein
MSVSLSITGPDVPCQIHKAGCKDIKKAWHNSGEVWTSEFNSKQQLAEEIWGDPASDHHKEGSEEWKALCAEWLDAEYQVMPCVPAFTDESPAITFPTHVARVTRNHRNSIEAGHAVTLINDETGEHVTTRTYLTTESAPVAAGKAFYQATGIGWFRVEFSGWEGSNNQVEIIRISPRN